MEWAVSFKPRPLYHWTGTSCIASYVGPTRGLVFVKKRTICWTFKESNQCLSVLQLVLLSWQRCRLPKDSGCLADVTEYCDAAFRYGRDVTGDAAVIGETAEGVTWHIGQICLDRVFVWCAAGCGLNCQQYWGTHSSNGDRTVLLLLLLLNQLRSEQNNLYRRSYCLTAGIV